MRRVVVPSHFRQIVCDTLSRKTLHKNRTGRVAQGEFNKKKKRERELMLTTG
jgi:hypothetical protein